MPGQVAERSARVSPELRRRLWGAVGILSLAGAVLLFAAALGRRVVWNLSPSVPRGLYALMSGRACGRGALVSFHPTGVAAATIYRRDYLPVGAGLIKRLVGLPGDRACVRTDGFYVNGTRFGDVALADSRGRPLAPYRFCGAVPPGQAFVATTAHLSYDSRYFGPVPLSSLTPVVPLWTY